MKENRSIIHYIIRFIVRLKIRNDNPIQIRGELTEREECEMTQTEAPAKKRWEIAGCTVCGARWFHDASEAPNRNRASDTDEPISCKVWTAGSVCKRQHETADKAT